MRAPAPGAQNRTSPAIFSRDDDVGVFYARIELTINKPGRGRMRRQDACDLALEKERVACLVGGEREGTVEPVRNLIGRVIIRIHCDWKKHKLIVGFVGNRQPDRLNVVFREILSEALPAFALAKGAGAYG